MRYCATCRAAFQALTKCPRDALPLSADLSDPLLGHSLNERYRILERIAAGGMGQVYRAAHTRIASLFAVKVLYGDIAQDPEMRARFQREAEAISLLQSRHIVRVVDFDESPEGLLYLAMEHLDGQTLASVIRQEAPLPIERALHIAIQIARGLAHAHERGIVHRDLKPQNVMLIVEDDEPDVARLLDFGIARLQRDSKLTRSGTVMGTPEYMAPEQFAGSDVDARADLYAFGILVYEMLSGAPPFQGSSLRELASQHMLERPPPLAETRASLPRDVDAILERLLAKSPDNRFASARAVVEALRRIEVKDPTRPDSKPRDGPVVGAPTIEAIFAAIQVGAPMYNRGDHGGCVRTYRDTAAAILRGELRPDTAVAVSARVELGLERAAAAANTTLAAWQLRYAFDDLIQASSLTAPVRPAASTANELAAAAAIAVPRYGAGDLDLVGDYYLRFAVRLLEAVRRRGSEPGLVASLEPAIAAAQRLGGGHRALAPLGRVLGDLQQGVLPTATPFTGVASALASPSGVSVDIAHRLADAIAAGAPAYNMGDAERCYRIYAHTASAVVNEVGVDPRCSGIRELLTDALDRAAKQPSDQGAWTLRHAFDAVLAASRGN